MRRGTTSSIALLLVALCMCRPFNPAAEDGGVSDAGSSGGASWCAANAPTNAFCADFDQVPTAESGWKRTRAEASGSVIELATAMASSPPRSARMTLDAASANNPCTYSELVYESSAPSGKGHVAFDLWMPETTDAAFVRFGNDCAIDVEEYGVYVELDSNGLDGGFTEFATPIPKKKWTRVSIDLDFESAAPFFMVTHDGDPTPITKPLDPRCKASKTLTLDLGIHCSVGTSPSELYFDNVVMTPR